MILWVSATVLSGKGSPLCLLMQTSMKWMQYYTTDLWLPGLAGALRGAEQRPAPRAPRPAPRAPERPRSRLGVTIPESPARPILLRPVPYTGLACSRISFRRRAPRACSIPCLRAAPRSLRSRAYARKRICIFNIMRMFSISKRQHLYFQYFQHLQHRPQQKAHGH